MTVSRAKTDDEARLEWLGVGGGFYMSVSSKPNDPEIVQLRRFAWRIYGKRFLFIRLPVKESGALGLYLCKRVW
jgi:hypothetical protein